MSANLLLEHYQKDQSIAFLEGYWRETAIALELVIKAVICLETEAPPTAMKFMIYGK